MKKCFILLTISIIFAGCLATDNGYSSTGYNSSFKETPEFKSVLKLTNTQEPVHFRGIITLQEGTCRIVISKPNGDLAREYNLESPGAKNLIADFNAVKGRWTLEMTSENAVGEFKLHWDNKKE